LKFGCTEFINPKDFPDKKFSDVMIEKTNGGLDYAIECVGTTTAMVCFLMRDTAVLNILLYWIWDYSLLGTWILYFRKLLSKVAKFMA